MENLATGEWSEQLMIVMNTSGSVEMKTPSKMVRFSRWISPRGLGSGNPLFSRGIFWFERNQGSVVDHRIHTCQFGGVGFGLGQFTSNQANARQFFDL